jgi:hypothetical protein
MSLLDNLFWRGKKRYSYPLFDASDDGKVITEVKTLYDRPGIRFSLRYERSEQEKEIQTLENDLKEMKSPQHKTIYPEEETKETEEILKLLKNGKMRVFTAVVEIDAKYVTKEEKDGLIEKIENAEETGIREIIKNNPE